MNLKLTSNGDRDRQNQDLVQFQYSNRPHPCGHQTRHHLRCLFIDMAIPDGHNIMVKEIEKLKMFTDTWIKVDKMWDVQATVAPVIIGMLGAYTNELKKVTLRKSK